MYLHVHVHSIRVLENTIKEILMFFYVMISFLFIVGVYEF